MLPQEKFDANYQSFNKCFILLSSDGQLVILVYEFEYFNELVHLLVHLHASAHDFG